MNRLLISTAFLFGVSSLVLDSTIKGSAILLLAIGATMLLRRDSAATRHLIWTVSIVAILVIPIFTLLLPKWQVLPSWVAFTNRQQEASSTTPIIREPALVTNEENDLPYPDNDAEAFDPNEFEGWPVADSEAFEANELPATGSSKDIPNRSVFNGIQSGSVIHMKPVSESSASAINNQTESAQKSTVAFWSWFLSIIWLVGVGFWVLRLFAARLVLFGQERKAEWAGTWRNSHLHSENNFQADKELVETFAQSCRQIGIKQQVQILVHSQRTVPLVWGLLTFRLLLPDSARDWSREQMRSVILHELAHIKRRDTLVQLLTQFACALHWFNPLVWYAALRIHVERETACDDMVLQSGVRATVYAEHLLNVSTKLTQQRWTSACGLAMTTGSQLEDRVVAIVSGGRNRRNVTGSLAMLALMFGIGISVPVAMLHASASQTPADNSTLVKGLNVTDSPVLGTADNSANQSFKKSNTPNQNDDRAISNKTVQKLKWGKEVNGLRMALAWPPTLDEKLLGKSEEFFLVIQNVSKKAINLKATQSSPNPRRLFIREDGLPLSAFSDTKAMPVDQRVQPGEFVFFRLFHSQEKIDGKKTVSAALEGDVRQDPRFTLTAEMKIDQSEEGAWKGTLKTGQTRGSLDVIAPNHSDAKLLFKSWQSAARLDGRIPGGLIGKLREGVEQFISYNPTWSTTPQLKKMLPEFDSSKDWKAQQAVTLLNKLSAIQSSPIRMALDAENASLIRTGFRLPSSLESAPWGDPLENGLRHAWMLEPKAEKHQIGTALKARLLIHNSGKQPVVFRTRNWHQLKHQATGTNGLGLKTQSTSWTTRGILMTYRLGPNEFVELYGPGLGIGPRQDSDDWKDYRVGTWIDAAAGEKVTVMTSPLPLHDWRQETIPSDDTKWWQERIKERLSRHLPFPADKKSRLRLLHRVSIEVLGTSPRMDTNAAFVDDKSPNPIDSLAKRLASRQGFQAYQGAIQSGVTKLTVVPLDPKAAQKPRMVTGPGRYTLGESLRLVVSRSLKADMVVNDGSIRFYPKGKPNVGHDLKLPKGFGTWAVAWHRGKSVLWIAQKNLVRKVDYSDPNELIVTQFEALKSKTKVPEDIWNILEPMTKANARFSNQSPPAAIPTPHKEKSKPDEKIEIESLHGFWNGTNGGKAFNLSFHRPPADKETLVNLYIGRATIGMPMAFRIESDGQTVTLISSGKAYGKLTRKGDNKLVVQLANQTPESKSFELTLQTQKAKSEPVQKEPRELFQLWKKSALPDGKIDGSKIGQLAAAIRKYVKQYPNYHSSQKLPKLLHRFDTKKNWSLKEVVSLLNDVAYYSTEPIEELIRVSNQKATSQRSFSDEKRIAEYGYVGIPKKALEGKGVTWSRDQNGLSLGYRIAGDRWQIRGDDLKVELWVLNSSKKDVKFRCLARKDEGLRVKLTDKNGKTHFGNVTPNDVPLIGIPHELPPSYCVKVNQFSVRLLSPLLKAAPSERISFLVAPGKYKFQCEVSIPGFSATGRNGKVIVPVEGEWKGRLKTRELDIEVVATKKPTARPSSIEKITIQIDKDGAIQVEEKKVRPGDLEDVLRGLKAKSIVIESHQETEYKKVIEVLNAVNSNGIKDISLRQIASDDK